MKKRANSRKLSRRLLSMIMAAAILAGFVLPGMGSVSAEENALQASSEQVGFDGGAGLDKFDLYSSSTGGFVAQNGMLMPNGEAGEFKAIYKDNGQKIQSVSVELHPRGVDAPIYGGLYIAASNPGNELDQINAVYVGIESHFTGWSDAINRVDVVVGQFPTWQEYSRTVSETGLGNALFAGSKQPIKLQADIAGNSVKITVSLVNDPAKKVVTTYAAPAGTDLTAGAVGIRSNHNDAMYDNFTVTYEGQLADEETVTHTVDFAAADSADNFGFYHSSNGGFAVEEGKLVPTGDAGEFKAIYQNDKAEAIRSVSVEIAPSTSGAMVGGLYIGATDPDHPVDKINAVYVGIESNFPHENEANWEDAPNRTDILVGQFPVWKELNRTVTETALNNSMFTGGVKEPIKLTVDILGDRLTITLSLVSNPDRKVTTTCVVGDGVDYSLGAVGIRSPFNDATYDNFTVTYVADEETIPEQPLVPTDTVDFEAADSSDKFDFYHSSNGGFAVENGKLVPTGETGEFKAIYKDTNAKFSFAKVDIIPGESNKINGGLYIDVTEADHPADKITALYFGLEGDFPHGTEPDWEDSGNRMDLLAGSFPTWTEFFRLVTETGAGNALFTGGVKEPVTLLVQIEGKEVTMTVSLVSDPSRFVTKVYEYQGESDLSLGNVGIRSQMCDASFDNFAVGYETVEADKEPDIVPSAPNPTPTDLVDFEAAESNDKFKFYHSSNGGFVVENGKLVPTGETGEFKAIYKDTNAKFSFVKVDIIPGESNMIDAGLYIDVINPGHPIDSITALYFGLEGNFPREGEADWDDAGNRMDMIAGCFPVWEEYFRLVTETGAGNALFTGGVKEPVTLLVQIDGNEVTMTVSLVSDPTRFVTKVYEYQGEGDLSLGNVGIRSRMCDASFDNFAVGSETVEADKEPDIVPSAPNPTPTDLVDFEAAESNDKFKFYHSSNGGFVVENGKLIPTGETGEFKAIYKDTNAKFSFVKVDIIPGESNMIDAGLYIDVINPGHPIDRITALYFGLEGNFPREGEADWDDAGNRMDMIAGCFPVWEEYFRLVTETGAGNALFTGGKKEPITLLVQIDGNEVTMTVSLVSDPTRFVTKVYEYQGVGDLSLGNVGIRSRMCDASFDNFAVGYETVEADKDPDMPAEAPNPEATDLVDFETAGSSKQFDFYHSSMGGLVVKDGKLVPTGQTGEFKAIYKDTNAKFSFVKVDIIPGETDMIDAGLYIDVTNPDHPIDKITALYFGLEGNFPREGEADWEDSGNRMDMIAGCFPTWSEYFRLVTETGAGNALFTGGKKEPVTLLVQINGNEVTMTVSLVSNPGRYVSKTYVYEGEGDLSLGNVGIRSRMCDASFDNFAVGYETVEADKEPDTVAPGETPTVLVDFNSSSSKKQFDFYHSSTGGLTVKNGKLVPAGQKGEFKAIYRDGGDTIQSVSVDIFPGKSGEINSGLYIGTSTVEHGADMIKGLVVMVESNSKGWDDAVNRIDLVVGRFPIWKELYRYTSETGNGNALFAGKKEPLRLRVDISGNKLIITLSLLSDPDKFVSTTYIYNGATDLAAHNVGVRSAFNDVAFDNFAVYTLEGGGSKDSAGSSSGSNPPTGDAFRPELLMTIMLICMAAVMTLGLKKRKI